MPHEVAPERRLVDRERRSHFDLRSLGHEPKKRCCSANSEPRRLRIVSRLTVAPSDAAAISPSVFAVAAIGMAQDKKRRRASAPNRRSNP